MQTYQPHRGEDIEEFFRRMVEIANRIGKQITAKIDDLELPVPPGTTPYELLELYRELSSTSD